MSSDELDISSMLSWTDGLPLPQWDLIENWVESCHEPSERRDAWTAVGRQWLAELGPSLRGGYVTIESDNVLALVSRQDETSRHLLPLAERCRATLLSTLSGVADFDGYGKQILIVLRNSDHYYRYVSQFYSEGEHGGSGGMHIREGYSHIVLYGKQLWALEDALAHELTHASLQHLSMPLWLEEGLAQMFEHDMTGRQLLDVNEELASLHKRYWNKHGLDEFWRGEGFASRGKVQELSYQLAEILVRLLIDESQPRWFGLVREPQIRFFEFLRTARITDCGEEACEKHLQCDLSELASKFLGPGSWSPSL